ncbi:LOW QUALITY PROTEIN: flocculation protein FLO11 [Drosophila ficusphila]|uniref:LOW QUALITY PROTEIN: flocculation protein FLO11 n=1 Tax=Drosophila ficusphila TaxID=30025 RepID=UPI0007E87260|nr:LOW QUALITY PROTEIN: flocculation protein FLO11 [Drosophila ficusphila]
MSCQQASRFHHSATATATFAKSTATRRIATATITAAATATTTTATALATAAVTKNAATLTPVESIAAKTTSEDSDPYAFTETVAVPPPILFNAQKSRARLSDSNRGNNKRQTAATAAGSRKANLVAQLNVTAAGTKALASLANANTTNFHHVTQSQRQSTLSPALQLQLPLQCTQSQSQASPKRATNVCIVRPQQQEKIATSESCQPPAAPPPLYAHTPSLWQTPLLLDNSQKQPQPQQQQHQQHQQQQSVAIALVSPPTSPASLPSPTLPPATAAVTAMVAPISVSPKGGLPLPPSKFHHTTLAQHLQKVECLKKKKSLPLACQNNNNNNNNSKLQNNNVVESNKPVVQGTNYNQSQPPPLMVFNTGIVAVPVQTSPQAAAPQKHSTGNNVDDSDLNEIPVNVIFRKPPAADGAGSAEEAEATDATGQGAQQSRPTGVKLVTPLTPPTPPEITAPPVLAHMQPQQMPTSCVPALTPSLKVLGNKAAQPPPPSSSSKLSLSSAPTSTNSLEIASTAVPATTTSSAPALAKKNEQMSSKVANTNAVNRQAIAASTGGRRGITNNHNSKNNNIAAKKMPPTSMPPPKEPIASSANKATTDSAHRQRRRKPALTTLSENEIYPADSPYCVQKHWLHSGSKDQVVDSPLSQSNRREERIAVRKGVLRRQALQLLSTRSLQELPMRAAKQRLQCVQNMLIKYQDHAGQQQGIGIGNRCLVSSCKQTTLTMAAHCERHIVNNSTQQLFQPCVAWRMDGTACHAPVFDLFHTLALCKVHSHLRSGMDAARPAPKQVNVSLPVAGVATNTATICVPVKQQRKRKANANPIPRPQKRGRKPANEPVVNQISSQMNTLPLIPTAGMQRKSSTTSLESIASNSHSSAASHSQPPYTPTNMSVAVPPAQNLPQLSIPPALAPLSGDFQSKQQQHLLQQQQHEQLLVPKLEVDSLLDPGLNLLANVNIKAEEISQIVAQLAAASDDLPTNNNNNNSSNHNNNNSVHFNNNNNNMNYSNNNNNQHSFPSFNTAFGNAMGQPTNTTTHNGHAAPIGLANTADLLGQDMFGICENSSVYASSEDTGLGGLSESELIGANDADDIALNGAHLLEEHDLVNVFDTLPDDAFNELFQSVQQAECEAMDRALEIADKNLKCLQQTIGGSADSAFLNDFLDGDLLAEAVMRSPNTSGIDAATLFVDSSSGGGNSSSNGASDIRGLVQT